MQKWIDSKNMKKILLTSIGILSITAFQAFAANTTSAFTVQPQPKDLQHVDKSTTSKVSINYKDRTLATLQTKEDVVLEYLSNTSEDEEWLDTGVTLTVKANGSVVAPDVSIDSNCLNHQLRLKTASGDISDIFYVNCNIYDEHDMPSPLTGMDETQQYGYTAGSPIYLVPDLEQYTDISEIRWQVSTNGGQSYKTVATLQPENGDSLIWSVDSDCEYTGNLYRYTINPIGNRVSYSKPIELIIYENYELNNNTLTVTNAGPQGIMNDYKSGRLANMQPWTSKKNIIKTVVTQNIIETGVQAFADLPVLTKVQFDDTILTIGEESFTNCTSLKAITIPYGVAEVQKDAFSRCNDLREIKFEDPDTKIDLSEHTIPQNQKNTTSPTATISKRSLTENEHSYPIIYGYQGIATDETNGLNKTTAGSTAYDYAVSTGRAFYPIGAIDNDNKERPLKWDYAINDSKEIVRLAISQDTVAAVTQYGGVKVHLPKTIDGYEVREVAGMTLEDANPICGKSDTSTIKIPTPSQTVMPANPDDVYIVGQPISVLAQEDDQVNFSVDAENAATYTWYYSHDNGKIWKQLTDDMTGVAGATTETVMISMSDWKDEYLFHCLITASNGSTVTSDNVWAKEEHTHDENCYSNGGVRDVMGVFTDSTDDSDDDVTTRLSAIYIPDTVDSIKLDAFASVSSTDAIYNFSKTVQTVEESFTSEASSQVCYTYSSNYNMRRSAVGYKMYLFDMDRFTGTTGDLTWTVDFDDRSLVLSGTGASGDYAKPSDVPYYWARYDVQKIEIGPEVTSIGGYAFADFVYAAKIYNQSSVLSYVSQTAFNNTSKSWTYGGKTVYTYINSPLFDAITDLNVALSQAASQDNSNIINALVAEQSDCEQQVAEKQAQIEAWKMQLENDGEDVTISAQIAKTEREINILEQKIEKITKQLKSYEDVSWSNFSFNWKDTTASCGTGVQYMFSFVNHTLHIVGDGEMDQFLSYTDAPWRPVNDQIYKIIIDAGVASVSNHAFNKMIKLRSVFNYGKNQTLLGGGDNIFDVIERHLTSGDVEESAILTISSIDLSTATEAEINAWYENIETQAKTASLAITAAQLRNWTLTCQKDQHTHTDSCYTDGEFTCLQTEHTHDASCYDITGTPYTLIPGEYVIPKSYSSTQIIEILTGQKQDVVTEKYIVPVYTFGDDNQEFSDAVPPESDGYKLMAIYNEKGQCGDDLVFYVSLDNALIIEGTGPMWDFEEGQAPWTKSATAITSVYMPNKMTSIGSFAFENMELMESFDVPTSVNTIGKGAFKNCRNLYSFKIGNQYSSIGSGIFAGCTSLRVVDASENGLYSVTDGYFVENSSKTILGFLRESLYRDVENKTLYINPEEYTVPKDVQVIGAMAYYEASSFYNLIIPESVTEIQDHAFYGCTKIENIDLQSQAVVTVAQNAIDGCGKLYSEDDAKKYVILYSVNSDFAKLGDAAGYHIIYHDSKNVKYITAAYAGPAVMVGKGFDVNSVQISIVYENGDSENIFGTDSRMLFNDTTIKQIGENKFTAIFDDGYGQILTTNEFIVEGTNAIVNVVFSYTGSTIWYGDSIETNYVLAKLTYADGSTKTVNGNATYTTTNGNKTCITLGQSTITKEGENEIKASYKDANSGTFNGILTIRCQNYITGLAAEYHGGPVELAAGAAGLDLDQLIIDITWSDGSTEKITGDDPRVNVTASPTLMGQTQIFEFTINDRDRYGYTGSFACSYTSNLANVQFDYVGAAVTNGMVFSLSDVQLTLQYTDGSSQKIKGDTVTGLEADNMIIHTADSTEEINLTYTVGANKFTGKIYVPGKIRIPVKLIVVKRPTKSVYQEGDAFDPAGMVVHCLFNNGITQDVTELVSIDTGGLLTENTKTITLSYDDSSSGYTIKTNMALNVNQYQKALAIEKQFKEQYEISKVLFRSKKTEDTAEDQDDTDTDDGNDEDEEDEDGLSKWQDITPLLNYSSYDENHNAEDVNHNLLYNAPEIKAGYGFELKVYTKYRTNRAGSEFNAFLKKTQWDKEFENVYTSISHDEFMEKWKYLNDVYPQAAPTANPDLLYFRTSNDKIVDENQNPIKNLVAPDGSMTDFLIMEKTNTTETGDVIDEGEWFNSTKIFELPLRAVVDDEETRRVYISKDAANPNQAYTDYTIQIISPAWFGYDPEPYFEGDKFHYSTDDGETYAQKSYAFNDAQTKYLHVCVGITIRVKANNDVKTHILE